MKTQDELARITRLLRDDDVLCRDGTPIAILPPTYVTRLQRHDPPLRLRVLPEDPIVKACGLDRYWVHHDRSEGVNAEYGQVPIAIVRAFIRGHGGFHWAGPAALAELQRAGEIEKAALAAQATVADLPPPPPDDLVEGRRRPFCPPATSAPGAAVLSRHVVHDRSALAPVTSHRSLARAVAEARTAIARAKRPPLVRGRTPSDRIELHQAARWKAASCVLAAGALRMARDAPDADESLRAEAAGLTVLLAAAEAEARKAANAVGAYEGRSSRRSGATGR